MSSRVGLGESLDQVNSPSLISNTWGVVTKYIPVRTFRTTYHVSAGKVRVQCDLPGIWLEFIATQKCFEALGRNKSLDDLVSDHGNLDVR
jgi:hypothetical protein